MQRLLLLLLLLFCAGCSTMKDVGVGMRAGGGFGGVGLLGSLIEASADLGGQTILPFPKRLVMKDQKSMMLLMILKCILKNVRMRARANLYLLKMRLAYIVLI